MRPFPSRAGNLSNWSCADLGPTVTAAGSSHMQILCIVPFLCLFLNQALIIFISLDSITLPYRE